MSKKQAPARTKTRVVGPVIDHAPQPRAELVRQEDTQQLPSRQSEPATLMFERLAKDPSVDVEKLERLIALQERMLAHDAKAAFDAAFAQMQLEIPEIDERGQIIVKGQLQSTYALNEDIQAALRPILHKHGFGLGFETEWPDDRTILITGVLTHRYGHTRRSRFKAAGDQSGNKNAIQALASTISYGHRYTTKDLLNVTTRGEDRDGHAPGEPDVQVRNPRSHEPITQPQQQRLFPLLKSAGRTQEEFRAWLQRFFEITSTKDITIGDYDFICDAILSKQPFPERPQPTREPGQEG